MSIKSRIEALEAEKGGVMSIKFVFSREEGVYKTHSNGAILTKDADGKFFYNDGTPLHGEVKEENTRTIVIKRRND